jgi:nucleoid-associated protein YgaU
MSPTSMSPEPHEQFRRELENAALAMRVILARRHSSARWVTLGLGAIGLLSAAVAIFLLVTGSGGTTPAPPPPAAPNGTSAAPLTTRRYDRPPAPATAQPWGPPTWGPPTSGPPAGVYTVKRGDTLARIALRSRVPMEWIAADNGIADLNRITSGQRLLLRPVPPGIEVIPPGATLTDSARRHGVRLADLLARNPQITDPNRILAGALLRVSPSDPRNSR